MKILAILLIVISLYKLIIPSNISEDSIIEHTNISDMFDPEWLKNACYIFLITDGLLGLFCGLFILFA